MTPRPLRIAMLTAFALLCALRGPSAAVAQPNDMAGPATPPGDAVRGKSAFMRYGCYECHGTAGQGNFITAPHLAPHPLPYAALLAYIRKPSGNMPSYSAVILPDRDASDIYAYLSSIANGKTPAQIPLLSGTATTPK